MHDGMLRILRIPEAESIMVFGRDDTGTDPRTDQGSAPLIRIQIRRVEKRDVVLSGPPLPICESIDAEMQE